MTKGEVAGKLVELINQHDDGDLLISQTVGMDVGNIVYNGEFNPCIPLFEGTDGGPRKRFTITITDDTESGYN